MVGRIYLVPEYGLVIEEEEEEEEEDCCTGN
jgi:hypothetical protein